MTAIIFIVVLAILIFVHELGHFIFAKWSGMKVFEFKLGFGPKILAWKWGGTEYGINLIPFGGFVKIHGENPDEDEKKYDPYFEQSFSNQSRWKQVLVLVAGVAFNFIFAWILYVAVFSIGTTVSADDYRQYGTHTSNPRVMITYLENNSPAKKAGLMEGDTITSVGLAKISEQGISEINPNISAIQNLIASSSGNPIIVKYNRFGENRVATMTPATGIVSGKYAVGIAMADAIDLKLPFVSAIWEGLRYMLVMTRETAVSLYQFVVTIFQGTANFSDVSGPIGIAGIIGDAAHRGITYLLMITAIISINLGVINLVPFPALDGGRTLFVILEGIFRRKIPAKFTNIVNTVGFVLLMILMVLVTYKDIAKIIAGK